MNWGTFTWSTRSRASWSRLTAPNNSGYPTPRSAARLTLAEQGSAQEQASVALSARLRAGGAPRPASTQPAPTGAAQRIGLPTTGAAQAHAAEQEAGLVPRRLPVHQS